MCRSVTPNFSVRPVRKKRKKKKNYELGRKRLTALRMVSMSSTTMKRLGRLNNARRLQCRSENMVFACLFSCLSVCLSVCRAAGLPSLFVRRRCTFNKYCVTVCGSIFTRFSPLLSKDHGLYGSTSCCISHWPK